MRWPLSRGSNLAKVTEPAAAPIQPSTPYPAVCATPGCPDVSQRSTCKGNAFLYSHFFRERRYLHFKWKYKFPSKCKAVTQNVHLFSLPLFLLLFLTGALEGRTASEPNFKDERDQRKSKSEDQNVYHPPTHTHAPSEAAADILF